LLSDQRPGQPRTLNAIPALQGKGASPAASGHAERLFDLLLRHGVATTRENLVASLRNSKVLPDTRPFIELEYNATQALVRAFRLASATGDAPAEVTPER
jgi:hypothetical protein